MLLIFALKNVMYKTLSYGHCSQNPLLSSAVLVLLVLLFSAVVRVVRARPVRTPKERCIRLCKLFWPRSFVLFLVLFPEWKVWRKSCPRLIMPGLEFSFVYP